ncbi:MAG: NAD-dependent deacetylase sirtuin 4 [Myxococcota bacterium]|jgi:NAD-dependent deacetylase sirtuin 4
MHSVHDLRALLVGRRVAVLTGAGCSTESGIPDYRGPETRRRARNPVQYRQFIDSAEARRRYWARSALGWSRIAQARPNPAHHALVALERAGHVSGVVTQNVDGLHQAAGSGTVIELHGSLAAVRCLDCHATEPRAALQDRLEALNPGWMGHSVEAAPDGDAELDAVDGFHVAACLVCGGALKPDVVFFGENVPKDRVEDAYALVGSAEALLVVGSSLTVFSGYRFVKRTAERAVPVALLNLGPTRADALATLRVDARAGDVLPALAEALSAL